MKGFVLLGLFVIANAINYECPTANLNIRSGAGTTYSIYWTASTSDKFQLLSTNGVWHQVKAASGSHCGSTGWAHSDYLQSCSGTGDCNTPSTPPSTPSSGPSAGSWVTPNNALNIRSGASTSNSVQWVAQAGDVFQVISSSNGWSNLRASSGTNCGRTGYASSQYLVSSHSSTCSSTPTPPAPSGQYPLYKQCNSAWGGNALGTSGGNTICSAGCAMSSVAMALTRYGSSYNPGQLNDWLKTHGGYASGDLLVWDAVHSLGLTASTHVGLDSNGLAAAVAAGKPVIANVHNGGHWVLVTGSAGGSNFYVNDPGYSTSTYTYDSMVKGNFVVYTPVGRVQSVRASAGDQTDVVNDASDDEVGTQIYNDVDADGSLTLRIVQHSADGDQVDVYARGNQKHQSEPAKLNADAIARLRRRGQGGLLRPVNASKPKNGPSAVQGKRMKDGPGPVQGKRSTDGPRSVQGKRSTDGPRSVQGKRSTEGPRSVKGKRQRDGP